MSKRLDEAARVLAGTQLFNGIAPDALPDLFDDLHATVAAYVEGDVVIAAGRPVTAVRAVVFGEVQMTEEDVFGNRTIFGTARSGDLFGEALAATGVQESFVTATAQLETVVLAIELSQIMREGGALEPLRHILVRNLMQTVARRNMQLHRKLACLQGRKTRDKVLIYLSNVAKQRHARTFRVPLTRQELADYLCVDRSALSTELGRMRTEGLIEFNKNEFTLLV